MCVGTGTHVRRGTPDVPRLLPEPAAPIVHHMDLTLATNLAVAALAGLAVGIEREWSGHTTGPDARFAGTRTFAMLGALGGMAGHLLSIGLLAIATALLASAGAFVVSAYVIAVRRPGATPDGTTEAAALVVLALGTMAGMGELATAAAVAAVLVLALMEKPRVQRWLTRVDEQEMRAAMLFAVLALVVLPLLPGGRYGPYEAIRPRELWIVVLLFSGLNFLGYIARQVVGNERGYGVTGLLGGLLSSTAVTLHFSRQSRAEPMYAPSLGLGVVAACTVLVPRVVIVSSLLEPNVAAALLPMLAPPFVVGAGVVALVLWRARRRGPDDPATTSALPVPAPASAKNPLGLGRAMQMAIAFQLVLLALAWMQETVGTPGVLATAAVLGLTDVDALTLSMTRLGADETRRQLAASAIAVGVLSNTLLKLTLTLVLGSPAFRRRASTGLVALALASVLGLWIGSWLARP
jgi:uncharacterized membrane protein (DUF4010 family)